MEKQFLLLLLNNEFYEGNKHRIVSTMFPDDLKDVFETIVAGHTKYNRDLTIDEVRHLYIAKNPTITRAQRNNFEELLVDLEQEKPIGLDVAEEVLQYMWRQETGRQIADLGLKLADGQIGSLTPIADLIAKTGDDFIPVTDVLEQLPDDVEDLIASLDPGARWHFNLQTLAKVCPGGGPGEFAIFFARPEVGKTAFWVSMCVGPDGFLDQGAKIAAFVNEEPARRTMARAISATSGVPQADYLKDPSLVREHYRRIRENLVMVDSVDTTLDALNMYCQREKPDIVIVDQLDKIGVSGDFARTDEKLRDIYTKTREIAKRHNCFIIAISQASAEAENKTNVTYAMMENSRTGKAAEADLIIGVGKQQSEDENDPVRSLCLSKNKISGWHGRMFVKLNSLLSRYED